MALEVVLQGVIPIPLESTKTDQSDLWNKHFVFGPGEVTLINAPSGTGKSTLIHLLYGLRTDYKGTISVNGRDLRSFSNHELAMLRQLNLSVVFQDLRLFRHSSGIENIMLNANLRPLKNRSQIMEMASRLGIDDRLDRPVETLSLGERQRVALIRALSQPFELLLLDEPFSHLDQQNMEMARDLITEECALRNAGLLLAGLGFDYGMDSSKKCRL